jgi:preprotein translocase subunit YajC
MFQFLLMLAEDAAPQPPAGLRSIYDLLPFIALPILFYLILIRPSQRKEQQARASLLSGLKKNDKVLTSAGIYGTVVAVSEREDEVTVRVDDNVRLKMTKTSIARNLTNEENARAAKATSGETSGAS